MTRLRKIDGLSGKSQPQYGEEPCPIGAEELEFELGPIRPLSEARSLPIRVTRNCPRNRCKFCRTYEGQKFGLRTVEEVKLKSVSTIISLLVSMPYAPMVVNLTTEFPIYKKDMMEA